MHGLLLVTAILTTVFLIYGLYQLNQRVVRLEDRRRQIASNNSADQHVFKESARESSDDFFNGLEGEELFYAMLGERHQEIIFSDDARKRYELIIRKHILEVLEKAKEGELTLDSGTIIKTLRGSVHSWLPQDVIGPLLAQGGVLANNPRDEQAVQSIQEIIDHLYAQLGYQTSDDLLGLKEDHLSDIPVETQEEQKTAPTADVLI
tara:strand:- start:301 stop:918 length:618 start_codon:yes stop_codon:yes gene_type:complete